jgi:tripartite-type tricarboxylate transporter receptor subunit TctC
MARIVAESLARQLHQPVIIENRPGGGGNLALQMVTRAEPDGYTLLRVGPVHTVNATLNGNLHLNVARDIEPVGGIGDGAFVMLASPLISPKSVPDFIAFAKANPDKINFASTGTGNLSHLAGELFKMMAGVDLVHVPYRGAPGAHTGLMNGDVQMMFDTMSSALPHIRSGRLRALAVTTATRWARMPDLPTVGESLPGYEMSGWLGLGAPKGTPTAIIEKLNKELNTVLTDPAIVARFSDLGLDVLKSTPADFGKLIVGDTEKWARVVQMARIKPE